MAKLATELYAFNLFQITIPNDKVAALDGGEYSINSDPLSGVTAALVYVEELIVETDHYAKIAPIAVNVPMRSGLFVCHDANTSYAPGGKLQLAGNIVLTSDASILTMAFGDLTFCEKMASRYSVSSSKS
ncbi:MAG: hypothetical protein GY854_19610 [Deltaproteobacteria bacterium]|nr:hypothetical protein [Deltaproteobacteria bacterium]